MANFETEQEREKREREIAEQIKQEQDKAARRAYEEAKKEANKRKDK
jgi:hypothetical protein